MAVAGLTFVSFREVSFCRVDVAAIGSRLLPPAATRVTVCPAVPIIGCKEPGDQVASRSDPTLVPYGIRTLRCDPSPFRRATMVPIKPSSGTRVGACDHPPINITTALLRWPAVSS